MKTDYIAWTAVAVALAGLLWTMNTGFNSVHERLDRMQSAIAALGRQGVENRRLD